MAGKSAFGGVAVDGSHIRMPARFVVAPPTPASEREGTLRALVDRQRLEIDTQRALIGQLRDATRQQADRIDMLELLLAPPGQRALARLRRSPWYVRLARRLQRAG